MFKDKPLPPKPPYFVIFQQNTGKIEIIRGSYTIEQMRTLKEKLEKQGRRIGR